MLISLASPKWRMIIDEVRNAAAVLLAEWTVSENTSELYSLWKILKERSDVMQGELPPIAMKGSRFGRHVGFIGSYLSKGEKLSCTQDLRDVVMEDLPAIEQRLAGYLSTTKGASSCGLDKELIFDSLSEIREGRHSEAIRKSFLVLTHRLRGMRRGLRKLDGVELVNQLFGSTGKLSAFTENDERQALRDVLVGLYTVYRNEYAHTKSQGSVSESLGIGMLLHDILQRIANIKKRRKRTK